MTYPLEYRDIFRCSSGCWQPVVCHYNDNVMHIIHLVVAKFYYLYVCVRVTIIGVKWLYRVGLKWVIGVLNFYVLNYTLSSSTEEFFKRLKRRVADLNVSKSPPEKKRKKTRRLSAILIRKHRCRQPAVATDTHASRRTAEAHCRRGPPRVTRSPRHLRVLYYHRCLCRPL